MSFTANTKHGHIMEKDVRRGIVNANLNESGSNFLMFEIIIVSIALGLFYQSWFIGTGSFILMIIFLMNKTLKWFLIIILSICCAVLGYKIGLLMESFGASITFCLIGFFLSLGANIAGLEYIKDIEK